MKLKLRLTIFAVVTFTLFSCTPKITKDINSNIDSNNLELQLVNKQLKILNNNSRYVGFVENFYFDTKNEHYIELYFNKDMIQNEEYDKLSQQGDSVIYEDLENSRTRIPIKLASENFTLSGLEPICIYNQKNELVSISHIKRIEYLNQNISPKFIAVFDVDNLEKDEMYYCIGNSKLEDNPIGYRLFTDNDLTDSIKQQISSSNFNKCEIKHYKSDIDTLSILNTDTLAYIIEKTNNNFNILYQSNSSENIGKTIFVPIRLNNKPVILIEFYVPDSDVFWNLALIFDGKKYKYSNRQRI